MQLFVYDTEGDGLLDEITLMHCAVFQNVIEDSWEVFVDLKRYEEESVSENYTFDVDFIPKDLKELPEFLKQKDRGYICHNQFGYDLPVFKKLGYIEKFGVGPDHIDDVPVRLYDSLVMSRGLYPDRPMPLGCPTRVANPVTKKSDTVGPHGLQSWGYRVSNAKPKVDDWRGQPLGVYLNRCIEDVKINKGVWEYLLREVENTDFGITWPTPIRNQHLLEFRLKQQKDVGVHFDVDKAKQLVVDVDKMLQNIADEVEPLLPERLLPKTKQPKFPAKPFKKSGELSSSGLGFAKKFNIFDEDSAESFIRGILEGDEQPLLTEPMKLSNQIDIKKYLVTEGGWVPTVFGTKDITRDSEKRLLSKQALLEKVEDYLMKTLKDSPYRKWMEELLGVSRGDGKTAFMDAVLKNARRVPMSPKFKDERGELCPNLEALKGDLAKQIVKWLSLRSRRTTLLPLDDKKTTGWLNDPRVLKEGKLEGDYAGLTNTYRLKHRGVGLL